MPSPDPVQSLWPQTTADGRARAAALATHRAGTTAAALVTYRSRGRTLLIGPVEAVATVLPALHGLDWVAVCPDAATREAEGHWVKGAVQSLDGHLGAFTATAVTGDGERNPAAWPGADQATFDLVLDLLPEPMLAREKPPPGYFASRGDDGEAQRLAAQLPDWVGEFDKPRYFAYEPDICAHDRRGLTGCRQCLDACAAQAIRSIGEAIEVDPYLCQGCGSCATVCPSGAITYAFPPVEELLDAGRAALRAYREAGGDGSSILLHDDGAGAERVAAVAADLPERVLPLVVEDVGGVGIEAWLALLAYGAGHVLLVAPADTPPREMDATRRQLRVLSSVLEGLGQSPERVHLVPASVDLVAVVDDLPVLAAAPAATFGAFGGKRGVFRLALEHLLQTAPAQWPEPVALPAQAPFGAIAVDRDACTLCMACVSVCPSAAVTSSGDRPRLLFREDRCVQCGLCEQACPEEAVTLVPRLDFSAQTVPEDVVLNEEEPFHCVACGKPFGTRQMMDRMAGKLASHWMFQDERARRRLQMCADCRVKDVFADEDGMRVHR